MADGARDREARFEGGSSRWFRVDWDSLELTQNDSDTARARGALGSSLRWLSRPRLASISATAWRRFATSGEVRDQGAARK